jgi:hypothetical protein
MESNLPTKLHIAKLFGWIWLLLIPVNLFFLLKAIFFSGSWVTFFMFLLLATISKWAQSLLEYRQKDNDLTEKSFENTKKISD